MSSLSNRRINKRLGPLALFDLLRCFAFVAKTKLPQSLPGIDAVIVPIAEHELHAVSSNMLRAQHRYVFGNRSRIEDTQARDFADAVGTQAFGSQIPDRVDAHVIVVPTDRDLCAGLLYFNRCGHKNRGLRSEVRGWGERVLTPSP